MAKTIMYTETASIYDFVNSQKPELHTSVYYLWYIYIYIYTFLQDLLLVAQLHPLALLSLPLLSQDLQMDHQETVKVLDLLIFLH